MYGVPREWEGKISDDPRLRWIQDICRVSRESIDVIGKVGAAVSGIKEVTGAVAAAAEEQEATLLDVARSLNEASQGVAVVSENMSRISGRSAGIESQSRLVSELVNGTDGRVSELRANMVVSLRSSNLGERRLRENRRPISVAARMRCGTIGIEGTILELSEGRLRFRALLDGNTIREGQLVIFETKPFGSVAGSIISIGQSSIYVRFDDMLKERKAAIARFLGSVDEADRKFVTAAREAAAKISAAFEAEIASGAISEAQMFDFDYRPIAGSDPQQFVAPFTPLCDRLLPALQEPVLSIDPRIVFCPRSTRTRIYRRITGNSRKTRAGMIRPGMPRTAATDFLQGQCWLACRSHDPRVRTADVRPCHGRRQGGHPEGGGCSHPRQWEALGRTAAGVQGVRSEIK